MSLRCSLHPQLQGERRVTIFTLAKSGENTASSVSARETLKAWAPVKVVGAEYASRSLVITIARLVSAVLSLLFIVADSV